MEPQNQPQINAPTVPAQTLKLDTSLYGSEIIIGVCVLLLILPNLLGPDYVGVRNLGLALIYTFTVIPLLFVTTVIFFILFCIRFIIRARKHISDKWYSLHNIIFVIIILIPVLLGILGSLTSNT